MESTSFSDTKLLYKKVLKQIVDNLNKTLRKLCLLGIWFPLRKYIDPLNIGLDFSTEYQWKLVGQTLYGFDDAVIEVCQHQVLGQNVINRIEAKIER
jgi:hypothetical protein